MTDVQITINGQDLLVIMGIINIMTSEDDLKLAVLKAYPKEDLKRMMSELVLKNASNLEFLDLLK